MSMTIRPDLIGRGSGRIGARLLWELVSVEDWAMNADKGAVSPTAGAVRQRR
jgi:hypothetical protein